MVFLTLAALSRQQLPPRDPDAAAFVAMSPAERRETALFKLELGCCSSRNKQLIRSPRSG